ncbi:MAG: Rrf2 family transcriptional regulator [Lachnospiraceae bacterium]|nr:Rrf2 family transcriptional regulator [Lachnospiraceae bacterium]
MKVSTKGRYALRLMVDLGTHSDGGKYVSLKDIAARQNISIKYLEQIVTPLHRAGLVRSVRGAQGGYRLSRDPERYTAGEILRAIEGSFAPIACLETEVNECERYPYCPTVGFWEGMYKVITDYVDSVTLQQLIDEQVANELNITEQDACAEM